MNDDIRLQPTLPPFLASEEKIAGCQKPCQSVYTKEKANYILREIAKGRTLSQICREPRVPSHPIVLHWARINHDGFGDLYQEARKYGLMVWADEAVAIADDGNNDTYIDDKGNRRINHDIVNRSMLRIKSRQWMLEKHMPDVYGQKVKVDKQVTKKIVKATPKQIEKRKEEWTKKHGNQLLQTSTNGKAN